MAAPEGPEATVDAGGASIPKLGLGTWMNTGPQCTETVETALELGYRHVDTAQVYGNEGAVGAGLEAADVDREDVFLTTKVWRSNLREGEVQSSVRDSLDRLGVEYPLAPPPTARRRDARRHGRAPGRRARRAPRRRQLHPRPAP